jgi:signal transduction histidine kinase
VQEALNNVVKHAQAQAVEVSLTLKTDANVELTVTDNGQGFNPVQLSMAKPGRQLGLHQMRTRVTRLNGTFSVKTEPSHGTTIHVSLPNR